MAISKAMQVAFRAISRHNPNIKDNYLLSRKIFDTIHPATLKYNMMDKEFSVDGVSVPVRIFSPKDTTPAHILLFFHGGGWVTGNIESYTNMCSRLSKATNSWVISIDYRLAPENPFPAGLHDCYEAAKIVIEDAKKFGLTKEDITLIGDSAGGNLTAAVSLMLRDNNQYVPKKQILIYPATYNDHSENSPFPSIIENGTDYILTANRVQDFLSLYMGEMDALNNPYFAPLMSTDLSNQPATLVITAEYCPLRDEGEAYGKRLIEFNNTVEIHRIPDTVHGFILLPPTYTAVKRSYDLIKEFLLQP